MSEQAKWSPLRRVLALVVLGVGGAMGMTALLSGPAAAEPACTTSWTGAVDGTWSDGARWSTGTAPGELDDVCIDVAGTYTVTLLGEVRVRSLTLGATTGAQRLHVLGDGRPSGSDLTLTAASTIRANGTLDLDTSVASSSAELMSSHPIVNHGTVRILKGAGGLRFLAATFTNASDGELLVGSASPTFLHGDLVNDGSLVVVSGGAVTMGGGSFASNAGSTMSLSGTFEAYDTTFTQAGGVISEGPVVLGEGSSLVDSAGAGSFSLQGTTSLSGTIPSGQTVTIKGLPGAGGQTVMNAPVTNNGTLQLDAVGGVASLHGTGLLTNNATLRTRGGIGGFRILGADITNAAGATMDLEGISTMLGGPGTTTNNGTINVAVNSALYFYESTFVSNPGSTLHLADGTATATADGTTFRQAGGTITGGAVRLRSGSTLEDSAGDGAFILEPSDVPNTLRGTIPPGQLVTVAGTAEGDAAVILAGTSVVNNGVLRLTSLVPGRAVTLSGSPLVNNGVLAVMPVAGPRHLRMPLTNTAAGTIDLGATTQLDGGTALVNNGMLSLEDDVDLIFTGGSFSNGSNGTLALTVNAAGGISTVGGSVSVALGGTLKVTTIGTPSLGATFVAVIGATRTGTFSRVTHGIAAYEAVYTAAGVDLVSSPPRARFVPTGPQRILDTRIGHGAAPGRVAPGGVVNLTVSGHGGVPATGASAVALTVTSVESSPGFVTVWPAGVTRPGTSNVNTTRPGQTAAVQVVVPLGSDGKVSLFISGGGHLVADVAGWYESVASATSGRFAAVAPSRLLDTRNGTGAPAGRRGPGAVVGLQAAGRGGVPAAGVSAVVLSLTGVDSTPGHVTVWPSGQLRPTASNLNTDFQGQDLAGHVVVPVGAGGSVNLYTSGGGHLLVDVVGWFTDGTAPDSTSGLYVGLSPSRRLDTRTGLGVASAGRRAAKSGVGVVLGGSGGIPASGVAAVVANLTAVEADPTYLTAWAGGAVRPLASNLNVTVRGDIVANLVTSPVGSNASLNLYTDGATHLLLDTFGYYQA